MSTPERGCGVCQGRCAQNRLFGNPKDLYSQARRVRCDRTVPSCTRCLKAGRTCDGFGLRLSWPRSGDRKRAVCAAPPRNEASLNKSDDASFVQTTSWDMRMHYHLSAEGWNRKTPRPLLVACKAPEGLHRGQGQGESTSLVIQSLPRR